MDDRLKRSLVTRSIPIPVEAQGPRSTRKGICSRTFPLLFRIDLGKLK